MSKIQAIVPACDLWAAKPVATGCDGCGELATRLTFHGGEWLCARCRGPQAARRGGEEVTHVSEALAVAPGQIAEAVANDRKYYGSEAPDYYTKTGERVWKGSGPSVGKRKEKYARSMGLFMKVGRGGSW